MQVFLFEFLGSSDVLSIVLSAEVVFSAIFTLALFIAVHALMTFMRQSTSLFTRLAQIEAELNVLQASIPGKIERIRSIRDDLAPLKAEFGQIQAYYSILQHLERRWQEEEAARQQAEEGDKDKQIQRQRLGLDRFL